MKWSMSGSQPPLTLMRAVPTLLRRVGARGVDEVRAEHADRTAMKSQTVKWKSVSTRDWALASSRARVAISPGCPRTVPSAGTPAGTGSPAVLQRPSSQRVPEQTTRGSLPSSML